MLSMASPTTASPSDDEYLLSIRLDLSGDDEDIWNQARVYARNRLRLRVEADKRKKVPHQTRDGCCEETALNMQDSVEPQAIACNLHAVTKCHHPSAFNVQEVANNRTERVNASPSASVAGALPNAESLFAVSDGANRCLEPSARSQPIAGQRGLIPAEIKRHHLAEDVQEKKQHHLAAALQEHILAPACAPSPLASPPWSEAWREDAEDTDDEEARATSEMKRDLAASRPPNEEPEVVELIRCICVPDESHCRMQQAQVSAATRHPPNLLLCSSGMLTVPEEVEDLVEELIETLELIEEDENEASAQAATQAHAGSVQAHACGAATLFVRTILSPIKEECTDL
jgi:hypothetical protein